MSEKNAGSNLSDCRAALDRLAACLPPVVPACRPHSTSSVRAGRFRHWGVAAGAAVLLVVVVGGLWRLSPSPSVPSSSASQALLWASARPSGRSSVVPSSSPVARAVGSSSSRPSVVSEAGRCSVVDHPSEVSVPPESLSDTGLYHYVLCGGTGVYVCCNSACEVDTLVADFLAIA